MRRLMMRVVAVAALAVSAGCMGGLNVNLRSFPNPVLVGPVMRIGDTGPFAFNAKEYSSFSGETYLTIMGAGGSRREGDYIVHESSSSRKEYDDIAYQISQQTSGRPDLIVVVDSVRAGNRAHWSIFAASKEWIALKGRIFDPNVLARRTK